MNSTRPNIIYILADDMGYGDMGFNNPNCKIPTPNLDRLAAQGMRFTDAHAGSSVCTPSRYSVLTGRYSWRSRLKSGIVWEWDGSLIEPDRLTVAGMLKAEGYRTACFGKWHLGWDWTTKDGSHPNDTLSFGVREKDERYAFGLENIDYTAPIKGGPVDRGFDAYFGVDVPNFAPYTWFRDDRLTEQPTEEKPPQMYGNPGKACPEWVLEKMIPEFTRRVVEYIEEAAASAQAGGGAPYFLYYPLTSPHSPIVPNDRFKGMSAIGNYGDFVCEVDWVVGQVMDALDRTGTRENTLLIFTSDNGPENRTSDDLGVYERARITGHYSMGDLRGIKRDAWEGGHRVPFTASWPAVVPQGTVCDQLIGLGDLMATCAEITGADLPDDGAEDSVSTLPLLRGEIDTPVREFAIHHSMRGKFAVRKGDWVYIDDPNGGDNEEPEWLRKERGYTAHEAPGELFNLRTDYSERENLYLDRPEIVAELSELIERAKSEGQTRWAASGDDSGT
jgi:arylsulfatase A